ncbi:hypothetical protein Glove_276g100 [Diversispora epigaea]|uniref:Protein kinase domain-containing protein n=1 Tax=Diversispora epigaea TaxID=1348612 RepID=A0A397I992_9GLOM|nr:hypothetical protein Glove_276g100 [Diversispora epigaea]
MTQIVTLSFTLDNASTFLVACYGLTKDPFIRDYMLVLNYYQSDLRHFLKDKYHSLTLLQKFDIIYEIAICLNKIYEQNIIHRDLHSGNILYLVGTNAWYISDLVGQLTKLQIVFMGIHTLLLKFIVVKFIQQNQIYEHINVGSETPCDCEHDLDLILDMFSECRPKIYENIPYEYATLMKQFIQKMGILIRSLYNEMDKQQEPNIQSRNSRNLKSKINVQLKEQLDKNEKDDINEKD